MKDHEHRIEGREVAADMAYAAVEVHLQQAFSNARRDTSSKFCLPIALGACGFGGVTIEGYRRFGGANREGEG